MQAGTKLGRYEISRKIGAGGMGEVFLAHDHALDRNIALKILLPEFCLDEERVQRFQFEARAVSALNHPNIITIHEIDEFDERLFIATEFIDGVTLREKIESDEISMPEALRIAEQVAGALAIAHEAHIIHRDIKPENIMIRRDGYTKILDFGLAKPILQNNAGNEDETIRLVKTQPGMVMGSVRYMSPEQARGKATDERTDVWSLGVVLYEMLTGENPFDGETISDSLAALIHVEPVPVENVPEELHRIIRKALKKNPDERYQSIKDFALDLKDLQTELIHISHSGGRNLTKTINISGLHTSENQTLIHHTISDKHAARSGDFVKPKSSKKGFLSITLAALLLVIFAGGFYYSGFLFPKLPKFAKIQVNQLTNDGKARMASVSPDGKFIAFVKIQDGKQSLVVRQISVESELVIVPPTNLGFYQPTFLPDGEHIYYILENRGLGTLYKTPTLGGKSEKILTDIDSPVSFSADGKSFAFLRHNPTEGGDTIYIADAGGGNLQEFLKSKDTDFNGFKDVAWSPDGRKMLVSVVKPAAEDAQKIRIAIVDTADKTISFPGEDKWMMAGNFNWMNDSDQFVFVGKSDPGDTMQVWLMNLPDGSKRQITNDTSDYGGIGVSKDGNTLVATKIDTISSIWNFQTESKELRQISGESKSLLGGYGISQMSNGRILYSRKTGDDTNIFSMNEDGSDEKQITFEKKLNLHPVASPDGKHIVFNSNRGGAMNIWRMDANGANPVQLTDYKEGADVQFDFAGDGKTLIFTRQADGGGNLQIMKVSIEDGKPAEPLFGKDSNMKMYAKVSPDGRKLAYQTFSYEEASAEYKEHIRIAGFENNKVNETQSQLELARHPMFQWSPDNKSLIYINRDGIENIWQILLESEKENQLTNFTSGNIKSFALSNDKKKLFIVRSINNTDLVLVKDTADG